MEDILASIRRIIADDQTGVAKQGLVNGARRLEASVAAARSPDDRRIEMADRAGSDQAHRFPDQNDEPARMSPKGVKAVAPTYQSAPAAQPTFVPHAYSDAPVEVARGEDLLADEHDEIEHHSTVHRAGEQGEETLLAAPLGASVMSSFEALAATVVLQNTPMLEGIMRDLLRPLVKTWLDDNLPPLVERLVRVEIERVARGTRG